MTGKDGVIKLAVNGKEVSGVSNCKPRKGYLALEAEGNVCWFRNIKIKELPTSNPAPDEVAMDGTGWERLANLVDLTNWKSDAGQQKHWQFKDWRLTYDGKGEAKESTLASAKAFGDFELLCDWRVTGSAKKDSVPVLVRGSSLPQVKVEAPGQWNRMLLTVKGDRMSVVLNGKNTLDNQQVSGIAPTGPITLQPQGNAIEFANLYIKDAQCFSRPQIPMTLARTRLFGAGTKTDAWPSSQAVASSIGTVPAIVLDAVRFATPRPGPPVLVLCRSAVECTG